MSSPESKELMKLFKCSTDVATKVMSAFAESKLLPPFSGNFQSFLNDQKHFFYHQWEQTKCCHCPPAGCAIRRKNRMDHWIFNSFYNDNGTVHRKHVIKQEGIIQQRCLHKYVTRNICLDDLDITVLHFVLLSSGKLNGPEMSAVETINDKRNSICHAWSTCCFSMVQMNRIWTEIDSAVSTLSNPILMPIFKSQIQFLRKFDIDKEEISSLSSKLDKLNTSLEELSGRIPTNSNNMNTTITNMEVSMVRLTQISQQNSEDIKQAHQALSQEMKETAQEERQALKRTLQHEIGKLSFTILYDRQVNVLVPQETFKEGSEECNVLWQLTTPKGWDLEEVVAKLKDVTVEDEVVKIKYVKKGSLIIMTTVEASTLNDQESFETAVKNFLNKIVKICHINTNEHAQVDVRLHILNPDEVELRFEVPTTRVPSENKLVQIDMTKTDIQTPQCESCEKRGKPTIAQYFCHDCKIRYCETCTKKHTIIEDTKDHHVDHIPQDAENIYICDPCKYQNIINVANCFCEDCKEKLCKNCQRIHQSQKVFTDHKIQIISEKVILCAICCKLGNQAQATCYCLNCENPKPLCSSCAEEHIMMKQNKNHQLSKEIFIFTKRQDVPYTDISKSDNQEEKKMMQVRLRDVKQHHVKEMTEKPSKPYVTEEVNKSDHIILKWEHHGELSADEFYQILMKQHPDGKWKIFQTTRPCINRLVTVDGLKAETSYVFKVRKANDTTGEDGPFSPESDIIVTGESPAFKIMKRSEKIEDGIPAVYRLPIQEIPQARNEASQTRKFILGTPGHNTKEKTVMIVGATGAGKSTLINGMANYAMGVTWEDPFRFTLIDLETCEKERVGNEALSQTEWITCYTICSDVASQIDYTINLIDTPGFGDTRGLEQDSKIVSQIRDLFTAKDARGVVTLDAVCFILKAPDARLTTTQKYIFESILAVFGNDIKNNICTLVTFADGQRPPVLAALEALDGKPLPFTTYFPFNNSALFVDNRSDHQGTLSPFFWEMGMKSCGDFFQSFDGLQTRSLLLTAEVLTKRQKLENTIQHMQEEIDLGLSKINLLEQEVNIFTKYKKQIQDNENFEYEVEESFMEKVDLSWKRKYTTMCLTCNFTCHNNCDFSNDHEKANCCAMDTGGYCTECPNNCHWTKHSNVPFAFQWYTKKVKKTYSDMKNKYQQAHQKKMSQEEVLKEIHEDIQVLEIGIEMKVEDITEYGNRLKEIALRPDPLSTVQYIELMIESEMREKKSGFNQRIETLEQCKKRAEIGKTLQIFEHRLRDTQATLNTSTAADDRMSSDKDQKCVFKKIKQLLFG